MAESSPSAGAGERMQWMRRLLSGEIEFDEVPQQVVEAMASMMGRSAGEVRAFMHRRAERERGSPKPGAPAPDFELERLSSDGRRTGELVRMSDHLDRPVALVFGSYT